jgi:hypothetical protein
MKRICFLAAFYFHILKYFSPYLPYKYWWIYIYLLWFLYVTQGWKISSKTVSAKMEILKIGSCSFSTQQAGTAKISTFFKQGIPDWLARRIRISRTWGQCYNFLAILAISIKSNAMLWLFLWLFPGLFSAKSIEIVLKCNSMIISLGIQTAITYESKLQFLAEIELCENDSR